MFAHDTCLRSNNSTAVELVDTLQVSSSIFINWTPVNHMALKSSKSTCMYVSTWQRKDNVFPVSNRIHWRSNQWTGNLRQSTGGNHWDWFVMVWAFYLIRQASITNTSTNKYYTLFGHPFQENCYFNRSFCLLLSIHLQYGTMPLILPWNTVIGSPKQLWNWIY